MLIVPEVKSNVIDVGALFVPVNPVTVPLASLPVVVSVFVIFIVLYLELSIILPVSPKAGIYFG